MRELRFARKGPETAGALVVFLHGYGADGADLLGLADVLGPHLPGVAFAAPDAPERCVGGGHSLCRRCLVVETARGSRGASTPWS